MHKDRSAAKGDSGPDGLLLCGGRGRRMGGADKGLLNYGGRLAVVTAAGLLQPHCETLLISANRNLQRYADLGLGDVLRDLRPDFPGPLAALEAAATRSIAPVLLTLPCDMPDLAPEVPGELLKVLESDDTLDGVYARAEGDNHYLVAALRRRTLGSLGDFLDGGGRAVRHWFARHRIVPVDLQGALAAGFRNLNEPRSEFKGDRQQNGEDGGS